MARFVIADISDAKSVLQELRGIVPDNPTLPVQPIIVARAGGAGHVRLLQDVPLVPEGPSLDDQAQLLAHLNDRVIGPVEAEVAKLRT